MAAQLHFLMIPLLAQSHIIPLTDLAKSLARRGAFISIVTTPLNAKRYKSTVNDTAAEGLRIQILPLHFPCREAGLPDGCENLDTLTNLDLARQFLSAFKMLQSPLQTLIHGLNPKPSCIISTSTISWTREIAAAVQIPHYVFETVSCFTLHCSRKIPSLLSDSQPFLIPDIPLSIDFFLRCCV